MVFDKNILSFPVTLYGDLSKYNEVISKGRCRIFYKYENRNGTYITDEFAEKLLSSVAYTPIKGIYDGTDDYTDHGLKRSEGRIYGVVPQDYNFAWEEHLDNDGVTRTYACVDVLVYTGIYEEEASAIFGKGQSMELYDKSIVGNWEMINGKRYFVFQEGCFLGLQVLGDETEPCFEGAAFYSLYNSFSEFMKEIENANLFFKDNKQGGNKPMDKINFKLSDSQKYEAIWSLLNPNFNEENGWVVDYSICEIYDEYAVVRNHAQDIFERVQYIKDDEKDTVTLGERQQVYIVDITEDEKIALDALQKINGGNYEKVDENYTKVKEENEELKEQVSEFEHKIADCEETISTLNVEKDQISTSYQEATTSLEEKDATINSLQEENNQLKSFKEQVELHAKQEVIDSYSELLSSEILDVYSEKIAEYSAENLDKELAYELKKSNPAFYSKQDTAYLPKDEPKGGLEELLMKYSK